MVRISVLNDALTTMYNAEKRGKCLVLIRPSSKVIINQVSSCDAKAWYIGELEYPKIVLKLDRTDPASLIEQSQEEFEGLRDSH